MSAGCPCRRTLRVSDPAPLAPDMEQRRGRGVCCIRFVQQTARHTILLKLEVGRAINDQWRLWAGVENIARLSMPCESHRLWVRFSVICFRAASISGRFLTCMKKRGGSSLDRFLLAVPTTRIIRLRVSQYLQRLLPRDICPVFNLGIKGLIKKQNISLAPL